MGNQIAAGVGSAPDMIEYQRSGKVRMLAVLGGQRQAVLPDVPTLTELGLPGLEEMPYFGIFASPRHASGLHRTLPAPPPRCWPSPPWRSSSPPWA